MKKLSVFLTILGFLFLIISCETDNLPTNTEKSSAIELFENDVDKIEISESDIALLNNYALEKSSDDERRDAVVDEVLLKYFAMAVAKSLKHPEICQTLKKKIGEKFDGDYDVLWEQIKKNQISGQELREMVNSRFSGRTRQVLTLEMIETVPLLQISLPVNFDDWDGESTILVAYTPLTTDDMEWEEITAYDADLKEYILDANTEPDYPVIVVGINERSDPDTHLPYHTSKNYNAIGKSADILSDDPPLPPTEHKIQVCDFCLYDDHEPWISGSPEIYVKARYPWDDGTWKRTDFPSVNDEKLYEEEDYSWLPKTIYTEDSFSDFVRVQVWEDDTSDDDLIENSWHLGCPGCGDSYYYFDPVYTTKTWYYGHSRDADLTLKHKLPFSIP